MELFSAIGRSLSTRRVSARRQEAEDSREENGIPTPAIAANATNFHHPGAGSVQITEKASPWAGLLCFVFPLLEAVPSSDPCLRLVWLREREKGISLSKMGAGNSIIEYPRTIIVARLHKIAV